LAPIHFYWSVKSEIIEPSLYILGFSVLLLWRTPWLKRILSGKGMNKTVKKTTSGQDKTSIKSA
ncbi:MAG TPA: sulfoxide reductase heme-binding subunit YedZ, partial [Shewanella baltica]|nr:sulfoxide reductase heme-binding subunit YedZ [Shewanella baltica]